MVRFFAPILNPADVTITWLYSQAGVEPGAWTALTVPALRGRHARSDTGRTVALNVPGDWASEAPPSWTTVVAASSGDTVTSAYYWIGLRIAQPLGDDAAGPRTFVDTLQRGVVVQRAHDSGT